VKIGVLGSTGPAGSGLSARLAASGFEVVMGSRSKYRAMEARDLLHERWPDRNLGIEAADNIGAAAAEIVVIATPWDAAASTALQVSDQLRGKVVLCMCNALAKVAHEFQPLVPPRGSVAASVQAAVPRAKIVAGMHHVPAKELGHISEPVESDVLICSDQQKAADEIIAIVGQLPNLRPLYAGELSNAAPIEAFAAVLLQLNMHYKTRVAVKFTGV